jgi:spore coat polysaccharide biosynthesis protein SpsF
LYVKEHPELFRVEVLEVPVLVRRPDLRLTIDYPEDLILCRAVYRELADRAPCMPVSEIVSFLDARADLRALVAPFLV